MGSLSSKEGLALKVLNLLSLSFSSFIVWVFAFLAFSVFFSSVFLCSSLLLGLLFFSPSLLDFVTLARIVTKFSCHYMSCDRN